MSEILLSQDWLLRLQQCERLVLGFSGGLDSTVLLHLIAAEPCLLPKIQVVHVNHGLSANALAWEEHCREVCCKLDVPLLVKRVDLLGQSNLENAARTARYAVFKSVLHCNDGLLLGHHRDDQAETLLLQLFRGAGIDGLSAMVAVKKWAKGQLLRPLLTHERQTLAMYAKIHQLHWVDDESNSDVAFSRNFLRHELIPLLQSRWPAVVTNLSRTAAHCLTAQSLLHEWATLDCPVLKDVTPHLALAPLKGLSVERINNILRSWFRINAVQMPDTVTFNRVIPEVIFAANDANPVLTWGNYRLRRYQDSLYLLPREAIEHCLDDLAWLAFPSPLPLHADRRVQATPSDKGVLIPFGSTVTIRFRQGGESLRWHGQTKSLKKLFQAWQIPPWERERLPLLYVNGELAAVVGYAISDVFYAALPAENVYHISLIVNC